jgi:hypothetical protein
MAVLARAGQHRAGAAADIQDRVRGHDQLVVETVARPPPGIPRVQHVIQRDSMRSRPPASSQLTRGKNWDLALIS